MIAARRLVALHAEAIDVREHAAEERPDQPVARIRAGRDAAVDQRRLDPGALAGAQQVRPDLGLHHDEQPRLDQPQRALDDEPEVEREIEDLIDVLQLLRGDLLPGHGRRRQEDPQARVALAQLGQQRPRGQHLADRDGVDPDRAVAIQVERHGQIAHALLEAGDVLPVADGLVQQVRRHHDEERDDEDAVGRVHAGRRPVTVVRGLTTVQAVHYNQRFRRSGRAHPNWPAPRRRSLRWL